MILLGLFIGFVLFVVLTLLCIAIPDMSFIDWFLIGILAIFAVLCGIGASKSKSKDAK